MGDTPPIDTPTLGADIAGWPFRLPVIRHIRWAFCAWRVTVWARTWARAGIGLGIPNESDRRVLDAIWQGKR